MRLWLFALICGVALARPAPADYRTLTAQIHSACRWPVSQTGARPSQYSHGA